jgi:ankyrin repeat protein
VIYNKILFAASFLTATICAFAADGSRPRPGFTPLAEHDAPVIAIVTLQDPQGATEAEMDLDALKKIENYMLETTLKSARENYLKSGGNASKFDLKPETSAVYMLVGGKKLAVVKLSVSDAFRSVWIVGFRGENLVRVACLRKSSESIPLFTGACGQKVSEGFGITVTANAGVTTLPAQSAGADLGAKLNEAARQGNLDVVKSLAARGIDLNARNSYGYTALTGAAGKGHTEIVRFLIDKGVHIDAKFANGTNALDEAAFSGRLETVALLLTRKANPNIQKDNGFTPLMSAALGGHIAVAQLLIDKGADPNIRSNSGGAALYIAASDGDLTMAKLLLKAGADPNAKTKAGWTAAHVAARDGRKEMLALLLTNGADPQLKTPGGATYMELLDRHYSKAPTAPAVR